MEIQADLIKLDPSGRLPLPWLVRAHLGLESNTGVSVFLTKPKNPKHISDILLTPLTVNKLECTFSVDVFLEEDVGAIQKVLARFGAETGANIVVSETVTLEGRERHKLSLVIEPVSDTWTSRAFKAKIASRLAALRSQRVQFSSIERTFRSRQKLLPQAPLRIENAFLPAFDWRTTIQAQAGVDDYDLDYVVVSSNPSERVLRFVFPKKGAFQLEVPHHNLPGALDAITQRIKASGFNILSSRLSRTPRPPMTESMSVFVAVCEPKEPIHPRDDKDVHREKIDKLVADVRRIDAKYIPNKARAMRPRPAAATRYPQPKNARSVLPPDHYLAQIQVERLNAIDNQHAKEDDRPHAPARDEFGERIIPKMIFLSHRFVKGRKGVDPAVQEEHADALEIIKKAVEDADCVLFMPDGFWRQDTTAEAIYPRLWGADACLILALNENGTGELSASQAHEYGFFMGQRKKARILVRPEKLPHTAALGNLDGFIRLTYDGDVRDTTSDFSLYAQVRLFINELRRKKDQDGARRIKSLTKSARNEAPSKSAGKRAEKLSLSTRKKAAKRKSVRSAAHASAKKRSTTHAPAKKKRKSRR